MSLDHLRAADQDGRHVESPSIAATETVEDQERDSSGTDTIWDSEATPASIASVPSLARGDPSLFSKSSDLVEAIISTGDNDLVNIACMDVDMTRYGYPQPNFDTVDPKPRDFFALDLYQESGIQGEDARAHTDLLGLDRAARTPTGVRAIMTKRSLKNLTTDSLEEGGRCRPSEEVIKKGGNA